ncbi:MAG: flotillin family protein [Pseudomonadota bacterium]
MDLITPLIYAGIVIIALFAIGLVLSKLYRRASKEISFVRTGLGGQSVVMNGGALVLPVMHETIPVNMNTLRLEVRRAAEHALITRDRMRVDVLAEFYVRVQPTAESIANAAQTLGYRTMEPDALKELVEGKFVDALRAVAAEMAMIELHEQRVSFVQKVQQVVSEDLLKNGLELESVSLTGLDQTSREHFNPDNAFDAEGLTKLTEEIEARRKRRNEIEQETRVDIERKNLDAEQQRLQIAKEQEYARLEQQREVEIRRAEQSSEIAREQAERKQEAEQAEILARQQVDQSKLTAERAVEQQRIEKDREVRGLEIDRNRALEAADVERQKAVQLAEQSRAIAIAEKSREQSEAESAADLARADAVQASEQVATVRETAQADRAKQIELIAASKQAETEALQVTVAAEADKQAAEDRASAARTQAEAEGDKVRIVAQASADAARMGADAAERRYAVDAEGKRALNESSNTLSLEQVEMQLRLALLERLPGIIEQAVKPIENIDGIRIVQMDGLQQGESGASTAQSLSDQVVNSALRYRTQAPLLEALLSEVGLDMSSVDGLTAPLRNGGGKLKSDSDGAA